MPKPFLLATEWRDYADPFGQTFDPSMVGRALRTRNGWAARRNPHLSKLSMGEYEVDAIAVGRITNALRMLMHLPGIGVFDYKSHLINKISFSSVELPALPNHEANRPAFEKEFV